MASVTSSGLDVLSGIPGLAIVGERPYRGPRTRVGS
jgi:hypothetical protein